MAVKLSSTKSAGQRGIKLLVHGPSGAGKTVLCATTAASAIIISAEAGLLSLRGHDIPVVDVKTLQDVYDAYEYVAEGDGKVYDWVCLDSISEIAEVVLATEKKGSKDPRQAYGALADQMGDLIRAFRDLPGRNVYFSCKQERETDDKGVTRYYPSLPGKRLTQGISYFFDEVFALHVEKDEAGASHRYLQTQRDYAYEAKDRSGALDLYEEPDLGKIAAKIMGTLPATDAQAAPEQDEPNE